MKVVILELLGVCVEMQPGLTEMFLNVQPTSKEDGQGKDLSMGRTSCLQTVLNLIEEKKQVSVMDLGSGLARHHKVTNSDIMGHNI